MSNVVPIILYLKIIIIHKKYEVVNWNIFLTNVQFIKMFMFFHATIYLLPLDGFMVRFNMISHSAHSLNLFFWYIT